MSFFSRLRKDYCDTVEIHWPPCLVLFDPQKVLRYWLRKDCGQSLDLNSASANELRTLPGLRGVDVSRIIAGRPYQSRDELLTREIAPQPTWEVIKDQISANIH